MKICKFVKTSILNVSIYTHTHTHTRARAHTHRDTHAHTHSHAHNSGTDSSTSVYKAGLRQRFVAVMSSAYTFIADGVEFDQIMTLASKYSQ